MNTTMRPKLAYWLKTHWSILRWVPWLGSWAWNWGDARIDRWHAENGR